MVGVPTSFVDHVYLGCHQRHCETRKHTVDKYRTMFESRIFRRSKRTITTLGHPEYFLYGFYDMKGDAKMGVDRYCELANKTTQPLYKVSTPCHDDHQFKRRSIEIRGRIVRRM